jgi:hypothetical protein
MKHALILLLVNIAFIFSASVASAEDSYNLTFSTYLGGSFYDQVGDMAVDDQGNIFVTGWTDSVTYDGGVTYVTQCPTEPNTYNGGKRDGYVAKFSPDGNFIWITCIGGPNSGGPSFGNPNDKGTDTTYSIDIDNQGFVYVSGVGSRDFPIVNAFQSEFKGLTHGARGDVNAIIVKLDPNTAQIVWSSYWGTAWQIRDLDVGGPDDDVYVIHGYMPSRGQSFFPSNWCNGCYQPAPAGDQDMYISRIRSDGSAVVWGTYLGGSGFDQADASLAVAPDGSVYVATLTTSNDIPTLNSYDDTYNGKGNCYGGDVYLGKLSADGTNLLWGTYLGGSHCDWPFGKHALAVDNQGNLYVASGTQSYDFPVSDDLGTGLLAYDNSFNGQADDLWEYSGDIAVSKFSSNGTLLASTYIGGNYGEGSEGIALDADNNVYFGIGSFYDGAFPEAFPVTSNSYQQKHYSDEYQPSAIWEDNWDGAFFKLSPDLDQLRYSSFMGTVNKDGFRAIATDPQGNFYLAGGTHGTVGSTDWPTLNPIQSSHSGVTDAVVVKFTQSTPPPPNWKQLLFNWLTPTEDQNGDGTVNSLDWGKFVVSL